MSDDWVRAQLFWARAIRIAIAVGWIFIAVCAYQMLTVADYGPWFIMFGLSTWLQRTSYRDLRAIDAGVAARRRVD